MEDKARERPWTHMTDFSRGIRDVTENGERMWLRVNAAMTHQQCMRARYHVTACSLTSVSLPLANVLRGKLHAKQHVVGSGFQTCLCHQHLQRRCHQHLLLGQVPLHVPGVLLMLAWTLVLLTISLVVLYLALSSAHLERCLPCSFSRPQLNHLSFTSSLVQGSHNLIVCSEWQTLCRAMSSQTSGRLVQGTLRL